jgi:pSer/pThr/pTyr-binding forkhead associated (FHA) protein
VETQQTVSREEGISGDGDRATHRWLLVLTARGHFRAVELGTRPLTVGRGDDADVALPVRSMSRVHARFRLDGDTVAVTDLGSRNGTIVNGKRAEEHVLRSGEVARLGNVAASVQLVEHFPALRLCRANVDKIRRRVAEESERPRQLRRPLSLLFIKSRGASLESLFEGAALSALRSTDIAGLLDDESAVLLLPDTDPLGAAVMASAFTARLAPGASLVTGVAALPDAGGDFEGLVSAAASSAETLSLPEPSGPVAESFPALGIDLRRELEGQEAALIFRALRHTNGHQRKAAVLLKLPLRTLERKLKELGRNRSGLV